MSALESMGCSRHTVLPLDGEIDLVSAPGVRARLAAIVEGTSQQSVVVDLRDVTFMDSTGIGALLSAYRRLKLQQRRLLIAEPQPIVARVLGIANIERLIPVFESLIDAIDHCTQVHTPAPQPTLR